MKNIVSIIFVSVLLLFGCNTGSQNQENSNPKDGNTVSGNAQSYGTEAVDLTEGVVIWAFA